MRVFFDLKGRKIYLTDDLGIAGRLEKGGWTIKEILCPGQRYRFPSEKTLLEFITWAEATIPPWKSVKEFIR